jgi:hypothetical protein
MLVRTAPRRILWQSHTSSHAGCQWVSATI